MDRAMLNRTCNGKRQLWPAETLSQVGALGRTDKNMGNRKTPGYRGFVFDLIPADRRSDRDRGPVPGERGAEVVEHGFAGDDLGDRRVGVARGQQNVELVVERLLAGAG